MRMTDSKPMIATALRVAGNDRLGVSRQTWDAIPQLLHCMNGAVDLETGILYPHDSKRMNWSLARAVFDPESQPRDPLSALNLSLLGPHWRRMIELVTDDAELQRYLQCALGCSMFGDNRSKSMFVLHGLANNGKSTMLNAYMAMLGVADLTYPLTGANSYAAAVDKTVLCEKLNHTNEQHPAGLAGALLHRVIVMSQEYTASDRLRLEVIKAITGNDVISARFMRQDFFHLQARCTPWMATNEEVQLGSFDQSVRTRIKPIELAGEITEKDRRPVSLVQQELADPDERTRLLAWLVAGARACSVKSLDDFEPASVGISVSEMIYDQDSVLSWMDVCCHVLASGDHLELVEQFKAGVIRGTDSNELYQHYMLWTTAHGKRPVSSQSFTRRIFGALKLPSSVRVRPRAEDGSRMNMVPLLIKR
jgi:putative DNA primase/helicase